MILVIDNYDSFVENLARYIRQLGFETTVVRNNAITPDEIKSLNPSHIILSPGPDSPNEAGKSLEIIKEYHQAIPMLGVCLGHQAIAQHFEATIKPSGHPMHGKASKIRHTGHDLFSGIPKEFTVGRYHSLIVERASLPECCTILAEDSTGTIMALAHTIFPVFGLQFHPESVLTEYGYKILQNFLRGSYVKN